MNNNKSGNQTPSPGRLDNSTVHTEPDDDTRSAPPSRCTGDGSDDEPLPSGWEMSTSKDGIEYYIDHNTRTTNWHHPSHDPAPLRSNSDTADINLSVGWEVRETAHGQTYFVDHNTRTTSWLGPRGDVYQTTQLLPTDWEMRQTKEGRPYFLDHNAKTTTWDPPWQTEAQKDDQVDLQTQHPDSGEHTEVRPGKNINNKITATGERYGWKAVPKL